MHQDPGLVVASRYLSSKHNSERESTLSLHGEQVNTKNQVFCVLYLSSWRNNVHTVC